MWMTSNGTMTAIMMSIYFTTDKAKVEMKIDAVTGKTR